MTAPPNPPPPNERKTKSYSRSVIQQISQGLVQDRLHRLLELAVDRKLITFDQAHECILDSKAPGRGLLGQIVVDKGWVTEKQLQELYELLDPAPPAAADAVPAAPVPPPEPYVPKGRYEILDKIGEGSSGEVHRARDREAGRFVALKFLKESAEAREGGRARFFLEAKAAAGFVHPSFVAQYDVRENWGRPYLVTELVEGASLATLLKQHKPGDRALIELLQKTALAVAEAHEAGIVHRDLKPTNILTGPDRIPRISDARLVEILGADGKMLRLGPPVYLAPEQVAARIDEIGPRSDIHALGAMLHEILTGRPPFGGANVAEMSNRILREEPAPARSLNRDVTPALEAVVMKALEKDPALRFANAREFADELKRHLDGAALLTIPPDLKTRATRWFRRNRTPAIITAGVAVVLLSTAVGWAVRAGSATAAVLERARGYEKDGLLIEALAEYGKILERNGSHAGARAGFDRVDRVLRERAAAGDAIAARTADEAAAAQQLIEARAILDQAAALLRRPAFKAGDVAEQCGQVRTRVEAIMARWPKLPQTHHLIGLSWELEGWEKIAEDCWWKAIGTDPSFAPARISLARSLTARMCAELLVDPDQGRSPVVVQEAAAQLDQAVQGGGTVDPLQRKLASVLSEYLGDKAEGARYRLLAILDEPGAAPGIEEAWWWKGVLAASNDEKLAAFNRAIEIRPNYALALFARGTVRHQKGDLDGAILDINRAVLIHPKLAVAFAQRSALHRAKRDTARALEDGMKAVELDPELAIGYVHRGSARQIGGDYEGAIADYTAAIRLSRSLAPPYHLRASAHESRGDHEKAIADADQAISRKPTALAYATRGQANHRLGRLKAAEADLVRAVEIAPAGWPNLDLTRKLLAEVRQKIKKP